MTDHEPQTLLEAVRHFSDLDVCHSYMLALKWPDGKITCPECVSDNIGTIATRKLLKCRACRKQFSAKTDTIFEDSPLGLDKWFTAVWLIANTKNGTSSCELARAIGVTQKTAWFMLHRIRLAMRPGTFRKMTGTVESDETFIGGKAENMHAERERKITGRGGAGKAIVHGLLDAAPRASPARSAPRSFPPLTRKHSSPKSLATWSAVRTSTPMPTLLTPNCLRWISGIAGLTTGSGTSRIVSTSTGWKTSGRFSSG